MTHSNRDRQRLLKTAALALALMALWWTFRDVRMDRVLMLLSRLGALGLLLAVLPQVSGIALDTLAWQSAFGALGARLRFRALLWTRLATEAVALIVPGGAVVAEPIKVPFLRRQSGLELDVAVAGVVVRKYSVLAAQAAWLGICTLLAWSAFRAAAMAGHPLRLFVFVLALATVLLAGASLLVRLGLSRGSLALRIRRGLAKLPNRWLRQKLLDSEAVFRRTDGKLARFFDGNLATEARLTFLFSCAWATETLETYLLLRLLGVDLSFGAVAMVEVSLTLLKNFAFVVPAGIGLQDLGYTLFLRAFGVGDATEISAALTLLKRGKELTLVALGVSILFTDSMALRVVARTSPSRAPLSEARRAA